MPPWDVGALQMRRESAGRGHGFDCKAPVFAAAHQFLIWRSGIDSTRLSLRPSHTAR